MSADGLSGWREIVRAFRWKPGTVVTMLWTYFDESGLHNKDTNHLDTLVIAGGIADAEAWDRLTTGWQRALDTAEIQMFHMADFEADKGEFAGWKTNYREKRGVLLNTLLDLIIEHVPVLIGFSVDAAENGNTVKNTYARGVLDAVTLLAREIAPSESDPLALIFAKHPQYSAHNVIEKFMSVAKYDSRLRTCAIQEPFDTPALQVADIVAYEMCRAERPKRPERYPLTRLKNGVKKCSLHTRVIFGAGAAE